jgi:hypothetical protein
VVRAGDAVPVHAALSLQHLAELFVSCAMAPLTPRCRFKQAKKAKDKAVQEAFKVKVQGLSHALVQIGGVRGARVRVEIMGWIIIRID